MKDEAQDKEFRRHHGETYGEKGPYERYAPAYRYGYDLAGLEEHQGKEWTEIEHDAKDMWEEREYNRDTWEEFKEAVRTGWMTFHRTIR
jgi:hypothetical protein